MKNNSNAKKIKALLDVTKKASSTLDLHNVADFILKRAIGVLEVDHSALFLLNDTGKFLILYDARGFTRDEMNNIKILGGWEEVNRELIKKQKPLIVNDIARSKVFRKKRLSYFHEKLPFNSFIAVPLCVKKNVIAVLIVTRKKCNSAPFAEEDKKLLSNLADHVSIALANAKLYEDVHETFLSTTKALITAVDAKDPYTHGHSERVMKYALAIAKYLKLNKKFIENLKLSSLLHDVGKIGISENILSKKGPLDKKERELIEKHPLIGANIVGSILNSESIVPGIKEHHERYDGHGYPMRLKKNKISMEGRIIAVADTFDTLTTTRPYQKAFSTKEAFLEISRSQGSDFDPLVVRAFEKSFSKEPYIWSA